MTAQSNVDRLITIFGGSGFLGRHVVQALAKQRYRIRVAVRRPDLAGHLQPLGCVGQIHAVQANVRHLASVAAAVRGSDVVINLVGVRPREFSAATQCALPVSNWGDRWQESFRAGSPRSGPRFSTNRRVSVSAQDVSLGARFRVCPGDAQMLDGTINYRAVEASASGRISTAIAMVAPGGADFLRDQAWNADSSVKKSDRCVLILELFGRLAVLLRVGGS